MLYDTLCTKKNTTKISHLHFLLIIFTSIIMGFYYYFSIKHLFTYDHLFHLLFWLQFL